MLTHTERENITVGQQVYLYYGDWRTANSRYTLPLTVTNVTKTQFTVAAESKDIKPKRFLKSNCNEVGRGYSRSSPSVTLVTVKSQGEVNKFNNKKNAEAQKKETKEQQEEAALRFKYNAGWIVDDSIQERFLKPLRSMAEDGEQEMGKLLESFEGVTIEAENFYRITDAVERETKNGYFAYGLKTRDHAITLHQRFVNVIEEFHTGAEFTIGKLQISIMNTEVEELLSAVTQQVLQEQMFRFFDYSFSNTVVDEADQKFI